MSTIKETKIFSVEKNPYKILFLSQYKNGKNAVHLINEATGIFYEAPYLINPRYVNMNKPNVYHFFISTTETAFFIAEQVKEEF